MTVCKLFEGRTAPLPGGSLQSPEEAQDPAGLLCVLSRKHAQMNESLPVQAAPRELVERERHRIINGVRADPAAAAHRKLHAAAVLQIP